MSEPPPLTAEPTESDPAGTLREAWLGGAQPRYWLVRFALLRGLGLIYSVAFLIAYQQGPGLIGSRGLLPAERFVSRLQHGGAFLQYPTLFYWNASDGALRLASACGLALSLAVLLGVENAAVMFALWLLDLSLCHVGQIFWGYGWEILLLEAGFLAIFLCPLRSLRPLSDRLPPSPLVIWMLRWLLLRLMLGAGLIKLRGDPCWRDLTCLVYHYETQPVPSPLSWWFHQAPIWVHELGVVFNHVVELIAPFGVFGPRRVRLLACGLIVAFQSLLIASGNLSFLNWLTLVIALACLDDDALGRVLPDRMRRAAQRLETSARPNRAHTIAVGVLACVVGLLSIGPVLNMLSPQQSMNSSFDPLHLVNTYGAFGTVGRERDEIVLQGTNEANPETATRWLDYELPCKPGDVRRRPCLITPYHYRLDWQMWFAAMSEPESEPWFVNLIYKLLSNEPTVTRLFARNPFPERAPRFVRAQFFEYHFTRLGDGSGAYYRRKLLGNYLDPQSLHSPGLLRYLRGYGLLK